MKHVVKRRGHLEKFSEKKLADSVRYACQSTHMPPSEAKKVVGFVLKDTKRWLGKKPVATTQDISNHVVRVLKKHKQHDCAFMYETHRDVS